MKRVHNASCRLQNLKESTDCKVPHKTGPHSPLNCPIPFLIWTVLIKFTKHLRFIRLCTGIPIWLKLHQRCILLAIFWQPSWRVFRSYAFTKPCIWWPMWITPLIKLGQIFWKWSIGRNTFILTIQWGVLYTAISNSGDETAKTTQVLKLWYLRLTVIFHQNYNF